MPTNLARIGISVFVTLFAIAVISERADTGAALAAAASESGGPAAVPAVFEADGPVAVRAFQEVALSAAPAALDDPLVVLASWYGPGFYGNRTACGQTYTPEVLGVAHRTLPCGTLLTLGYGGRVVTVAVIDRGPFVAGRSLDLSYATKVALGCTDLCTVRMQIAR